MEASSLLKQFENYETLQDTVKAISKKLVLKNTSKAVVLSSQISSQTYLAYQGTIIDHIAEHSSITVEKVESYVKTRARNKLQEIKLSVQRQNEQAPTEFFKAAA